MQQHNLKITHALITSFSVLAAFFTLYTFRTYDDNRLTSWEWVFDTVSVTRLIVPLCLGIAIAYLLSKTYLWATRPALFLCMLSFAAAVPFWSEPEVIVDAARYFTQAKYLELYGIDHFFGEWGRGIAPWTDMPLAPFLYGLIFRYFGETRVLIQLFTTALFSLTVVLTYLIGRDLWDREVGFLGGMLLLGVPYLYTQVPLMLVDVLTMACFTLAVFTFLKALEKGGAWIPFASIALFCAFFSKYSTWPMLSLPAIAAIVLMATKHHGVAPSEYLSRLGLVTLIAALPISALVLLKHEVFTDQLRLLLAYQKPGLKRWGESHISTFLFQIHPFITIAAVCSLFVALKRRDPRIIIAGWLLLLVVVLQIRRIRYIIMVFPMLGLMASYGLVVIRNEAVRRFITLSIVAASLVVALFGYLPYLRHLSTMNLKNAGAYLNTLEDKDIEVFTLLPHDPVLNPAVNVPLLDLFTKKNIHYHDHADYSLPADDLATSALRFTWEYRNPAYYEAQLHNGSAVVIISDKPDAEFPSEIAQRIKGGRDKKVFDIVDNIYRHQTVVTVYK
ncbi:MAG: glycosyltransferase family 39 protein [Nitrospirota bacterium]